MKEQWSAIFTKSDNGQQRNASHRKEELSSGYSFRPEDAYFDYSSVRLFGNHLTIYKSVLAYMQLMSHHTDTVTHEEARDSNAYADYIQQYDKTQILK